MSELLDQAAIDSALAKLDGWSGGPDGITRTAELSSFPAAIAVVDRVAEAAEAADHHPDIDIRWRTLTFTLPPTRPAASPPRTSTWPARSTEIVRAG